jgi:tetratricopeptide (TPR) repeat protein
MRLLLAWACAAILFAAGGEARAAWHEAKSKHFIIYADDSPRDLEQFAARLEKFDQAVRRVIRADDPPLGDGNRLTIFVLPNESAVEKMSGRKNVGGFYTPRASGSLAFVPKRAGYGFDTSWDQEIIFFHEYAHHLMFQNVERPYPEWMVEGFAEFASTAAFNKDGSVLIGGAAQHRAYSLARGQWAPLPVLLAGDYSKLSSEQREATVYARGWLLTHYLVFESARAGQTSQYITALSEGTAPLLAAEQAFGDLKKLDRDLSTYLRRITGSISAMRIARDQVQPGPVEVRPLGAGAAAVMPFRQQSKNGVNSTTAEPLAVEVRKVHARFPGDELVLVTLAEAEFDAGHPQASEAAADAALKLNPRNTEALIYKGRAIQRRAEEADDPQRAALFEQARKTFISANKIDPEDPEPLLLFHSAFLAEGRMPTANAIAALHYASDLAPHDLGLRMTSGVQYLREGDLKTARQTLTLVAYNPHGEKIAEMARAIIARIDAGDSKGAMEAASGKAFAN